MINTSAQTALKNSIYNFISFVLPIIVIVFITPIIISRWGVKEYGIYIFLNTITVFLGLLDLGISTATSKHIIEYKAKNQTDKLRDLIYSMNSIYLLMSILYFIICVSIGIIIQVMFLERVGVGNNYLLIFFILGLTTSCGSFFANYSNIFVTIQRYDVQTKISMSFMLLSNVSMLILVLLGYRIIPVLLMQLVLMVISSVIYVIIAKRVFPIMQFKYYWNKTELIKNYKFGISVAFNNLANSSLVHFDKLLIPVFLGNAQLTYYSVPGSIATKISSISSTFSSLLFPITVNLQSINDTDKIKRVYIRSIRLITILSSAISLSIIFLTDKILFYWLDANFVNQSSKVLILLVLTNFTLALFSPLSNLLTAMNKMKFLTTSSIVMAIINIISLFIFLPIYGINGAALSYLISVLFIFFMLHYSEKKYFHIKENIHLKLLTKIIITTIPFFIIVRFLLSPLITNMTKLIIAGPVSVIVFMILYKTFGFVEKEDWDEATTSVRKIFNKLSIK